MIKLPTEILKNKQTLLIGSLVGAFSLVIVVMSWLLFKKTDHPLEKAHHKGIMMNGSMRLDPIKIWTEKLTSEQEVQGKRLETLEKLLETLVPFVHC